MKKLGEISRGDIFRFLKLTAMLVKHWRGYNVVVPDAGSRVAALEVPSHSKGHYTS